MAKILLVTNEGELARTLQANLEEAKHTVIVTRAFHLAYSFVRENPDIKLIAWEFSVNSMGIVGGFYPKEIKQDFPLVLHVGISNIQALKDIFLAEGMSDVFTYTIAPYKIDKLCNSAEV